MKLTYRGIPYQEENRNYSTSTVVLDKKKIVYRGNSPKTIINPRFPLLKYIKQLLSISESKPVFDPTTFWYNHKREYIRDCWSLSNSEKLELAWDLTMKIEQAKGLKAKPKTKLKYRGVTYIK